MNQRAGEIRIASKTRKRKLCLLKVAAREVGICIKPTPPELCGSLKLAEVELGISRKNAFCEIPTLGRQVSQYSFPKYGTREESVAAEDDVHKICVC